MLTISGLKKFYFVPDINDMRCGAHRLLEIVKHKHHLCTDNGDVFIFMSKNQRTVKMVNFEENAYYVHQKTFANLVFNKYHMNTPVYREMVRLLNNRMNVSRNTVYNWFVKGSKHLDKVLPVLKEKLLAKGAVVNCDETWCRVKANGKYGKKYIWCMVNKEAHVRAKFKYALEQGKDKEAEYFLRLIGVLYDLEEQYRLRHLTPEQILKERQGEQTTRIIKQLRQRLDKLLTDGNPTRGDLMRKALNYLNSFLESAHPVPERWPV